MSRQVRPRVAQLPAELVDGLTELVAAGANAADRAVVVEAILDQVVDAVRWRVGTEPDVAEQQGLAGLVEAAVEHRRRMEDLRLGL